MAKPKKLTAKQVRRQDEEWELVKEAYLTFKPLFVVWANDEEGVELPHGFWSEGEAKRFVASHPDKDDLMIDSYNQPRAPRIPLIRPD